MSDRPLPLFPLAMVLLPGAVVPLHIFEPRYRRMVGYCLEFDRRFGLVYHDHDVDGPFMNEAGRVGCVAEIERMEVLEDGRSLILVKGMERFRILEEVVTQDVPYFEARIAAVPDLVIEPNELLARRSASLELFHAVLRRVDGLPAPLPDFDVEHEISYPLAGTVDTKAVWHQVLLEDVDERTRLDRVDQVFRAARVKIEQDERDQEEWDQDEWDQRGKDQ